MRTTRRNYPGLEAISARYEIIARYPIHVSGAYRDPVGSGRVPRPLQRDDA